MTVSFPQIQIRTQNMSLGFESERAKLYIKQPRASYEMKRIPAELKMEQLRAEIDIDQTRAWHGLAQGPFMETMQRIYAGAQQVFLEGLARTVEEGNRMSAIHTGEHAIAEIAREAAFAQHPQLPVYGRASSDNVDFHFTPKGPNFQVIEGRIEVNAHPNLPEIEADWAKLNIYVKQYPKVEIIPPAIDLRV